MASSSQSNPGQPASPASLTGSLSSDDTAHIPSSADHSSTTRRTTLRPSNSDSSSSSSSSNSQMSPSSYPHESNPAIGQIYLPGQPIVSSQHRALERYREWERVNLKYLQGVDMRTRWEYYIANKDVRGLKPTASGEAYSGPASYEALGLFIPENAGSQRK